MTVTSVEPEPDLKPEDYGRCYRCVLESIGNWPAAVTPSTWMISLSKLPKYIIKYHLRHAEMDIGSGRIVNVLLCRKH